MRKRGIALVLFTAGILFLSLTDAPRENGCGADRTPEELSEFEGEWFVGSGKCVNCHNTSLDGEDQVDAEGNDVSTINDWMGTIMANSARDPFWKAKVSHEGLANPNYVAEIEETCTRCHAPMGHYEMELTTGQAFLTEHLETDELGQDGVGCIGCHAIADVPELGDLNTGEILIEEDVDRPNPKESWVTRLPDPVGGRKTREIEVTVWYVERGAPPLQRELGEADPRSLMPPPTRNGGGGIPTGS